MDFSPACIQGSLTSIVGGSEKAKKNVSCMEKQAEFFFFILINVNFNLQIEIGSKGGENPLEN